MRRLVPVAASILLLITLSARGQLPQTRLGNLFPPGGTAGTSFEVRVAGEQDLDYATAPQLLFSDRGISAVPVVDPESGAFFAGSRSAFSPKLIFSWPT